MRRAPLFLRVYPLALAAIATVRPLLKMTSV